MPSEQPISSPEQPTVQQPPLDREQPEPAGGEEWLDEPEQLPRRPRRRLLAPLPLALMGALLCACGFIGGVLVEKGETSSNTAAAATSGFASRLRALAGATSSTTGSTTSTGAGGSSASPFAGGSGFQRPTSGTLAFVSGSTLYVTNDEGNTVKVLTSRATTVEKTVKSSVGAIHPGETVAITGATASDGSVRAESISVGSAAGGGLAALFGAGGRDGTGAGGATGGGAASLFGGG